MSKLIAERLLDDSRVAEARRLLHAALMEHQKSITGVKPADPDRAAEYRKLIENFAAMRGGELYYPFLGSGIGRGPFVELADGSVKYDMITGIGVHTLGHNHPLWLDAGLDAALSDTVMQGNLQQNTDAVRFTELLLRIANESGAALAHCFLSSSGAMADENALKIAFQKHSPADRILAFEHCFAGRTTTLAQLTDKAAYREGLPTTIAVDYVPFDDGGDAQRALAMMESHLHRYPKRHAAMWFELVQGEGGFRVGRREFFVPLMELCRKNNIAVVIDEVQTFGRTTRPFAFQHFGLDALADIVTVGKMTQVCATLFRKEYQPKRGLVSQTFTAATASIRTGEAVIKHLVENSYFGANGKNARVHRRFVEHLERIAAKSPDTIQGPFGIGGMIALTPFGGNGGNADKVKKLSLALYDAGVIAFTAGGEPTRLRFLPPLGAIEDKDIDAVIEILERTLVQTAATL